MPEQFSGDKSIKFLVEKLGFRTYSTDLLYPPIEVPDYYPNKLALGLDDEKTEVFIDTRRSHIGLILGSRGCGKSWLMRGMGNRLFLSEHGIVYPTDIKGEYKTSAELLQEKFRKFLGKKESAKKFPVKSYYPAFFLNFIHSRPDDIMCQLSLNQLTIFDLITLAGLKELSEPKRDAIETSFSKVQDEKITNIKEFIEELQRNPEIPTGTKKSLVTSLKTAQRLGVIGDQFSDFSFAEDITSENIPILNLLGWERMGEYISYPAAYVSVVIRNITSGKIDGIIPAGKKIFMFLDEATRWIPNEGNPSCKKEILKTMDISRTYGISMWFATQSVSRIPKSVVEQARYILLPFNCPLSTMQEVMKEKGWYEWSPTWTNTLVYTLKDMKRALDGNRDWLLIDAEEKSNIIFKPLAPLSYHQEEI